MKKLLVKKMVAILCVMFFLFVGGCSCTQLTNAAPYLQAGLNVLKAALPELLIVEALPPVAIAVPLVQVAINLADPIVANWAAGKCTASYAVNAATAQMSTALAQIQIVLNLLPKASQQKVYKAMAHNGV